MIGDRIGNYLITRKLGQGGMGDVYFAEHVVIGRPAAVKVLRPEYGDRPQVVQRFFQEARAVTAINSPGIVDIYDSGYDGNRAYIAMEYLDGETLGERLRRVGALSEVEAVSLTRAVAIALDAAHQAGIAHRDLKPDNIYLARDPHPAGHVREQVKLLDFGIAKLLSSTSVESSIKTRTGMVIGTPAYMSPEQCKGAGGVDHRTDLYALGCILFEMLCGDPPYLAQGAGEVMARHIFADLPSPRSIVPSLSPAVCAIVTRLLCKDADGRHQTCGELVADLDAEFARGTFAGAGTRGHPAASFATSEAPARAAAATLYPGTQAPTTLSSLTAAKPDTTADPRSRGRVVALASIAVILAAAVVAVVAGETSPRAVPPQAGSTPETEATPEATPEPEPEPTPEPTPEAAPEPLPAPTPSTIAVAVQSAPSGADVYRMPERGHLGVTPLRVEIPAVDGELTLVVERSGYLATTLPVPGDRDGQFAVELTADPAAVADSRGERRRSRRSDRVRRKSRIAAQKAAASEAPEGDARKPKRKRNADGALEPDSRRPKVDRKELEEGGALDPYSD